MKEYLYYPGCSSKGIGRAYEESLVTVLHHLGITMKELPDWNCCGATTYMSIDELKAFALASRNLALAERDQGRETDASIDLLTPCSACYLTLIKTQRYMEEYSDIKEKIVRGLASVGLAYKGHVRVRHFLDVFVNDIGVDMISRHVTRPLNDLRIASYYGCQLVRPYAPFDVQHDPVTMDTIMKSLGGDPVDWPLKTRCCGGSLTGTIQNVGMKLNLILLKEAKRRGADMIATACPLCQFNLECFQKEMKTQFGESITIPVVYFSQVIGLAMGLPEKSLGLQRMFVPLQPVMENRERRIVASV